MSMNNRYSHLVWLGAGNAIEPPHLLTLAEKVTLYEAREAACLCLKKSNPQANIVIKQALVTIEGEPAHFTEYNLAEYSAVHPVTGLKLLFPGIKSIKNEQIKSVSITEAIEELGLEGNNNFLVVDIVDFNLALLKALQQSAQLYLFSEIMIQAGSEPLYAGAVTIAEIEIFLQEQGYLLKQVNNNDPDLSWLAFVLNPLFQPLKQLQQTSKALNGELESVKQEVAELQKQLSQKKSEYETLLQQFESVKLAEDSEQDALKERFASKDAELAKITQEQNQTRQQFSALQKQHVDVSANLENQKAEVQRLQEELLSKTNQFSVAEQEQLKLINKLQTEFELMSKHSIARLEKIEQLEKANRQLYESNIQLVKRQHVLEQEMFKAQTQIGIIQDLLLK